MTDNLMAGNSIAKKALNVNNNTLHNACGHKKKERNKARWTGRTTVRIAIKTIILTMFMFAGPRITGADQPDAPDIVFIAIDDLNSWVGCMGGHRQTRTPNIDKLASRGILFSNAYCAAPICMASRAAVLSGLDPNQSRVFGNDDNDSVRSIQRDRQLPVVLARAGYKTLATGKVFHSGDKQYFDEYHEEEQRWSPFRQTEVRYSTDELPERKLGNLRHLVVGAAVGKVYLPQNGLRGERNLTSKEGESFDWAGFPVSDADMGDSRCADWISTKISRENIAGPQFYALGLYRPHIPLYCPQEYFESLPALEDIAIPVSPEDDLSDIGLAGRSIALEAFTGGSHQNVVEHNQWSAAVRAYLACIAFADAQVGKVMNAVEKSPRSANTWIVLWSDHGWHLGEKAHWGKWTGWRPATHVPFIIVPPQAMRVPRGVACDAPVSLLDIYPTILDICKIETKPGLPGRSLVRVIHGEGYDYERVAVTTFGEGNYAITTKDVRYILYKNREEELYDIKHDKGEIHNIAKDDRYANQKEYARKRLEDYIKSLNNTQKDDEHAR